jgi:hypothetical protein
MEGGVFEHVVGSGKAGSGNGSNGSFGATAGAKAQGLSVEISSLGAGGCPCALDEGGLEPGRAPFFMHVERRFRRFWDRVRPRKSDGLRCGSGSY